MGDVIAFRPRTRGNLRNDELSTFTKVLEALDEAESKPKVREALVDALGYDPCDNPFSPPPKRTA